MSPTLVKPLTMGYVSDVAEDERNKAWQTEKIRKPLQNNLVYTLYCESVECCINFQREIRKGEMLFRLCRLLIIIQSLNRPGPVFLLWIESQNRISGTFSNNCNKSEPVCGIKNDHIIFAEMHVSLLRMLHN